MRGTLMTPAGSWRPTGGASARAADGPSWARCARPSISVDGAGTPSARSVGHRRAIREKACDATVSTSLEQGTGRTGLRQIDDRRFADAPHTNRAAGVTGTVRHSGVDGGIGTAGKAEETGSQREPTGGSSTMY